MPTSPYNEAVQLRQALRAAIVQLEAAAVEQARLHAEVLAFHVLGCDRAYLFAHPERELTADEQSQYDELVARRAAGEPLQYLTGHQEFWKADFLVTPAVLIPRPETEHLVEAVLELVRGILPSPHLPKEGKYGPPGLAGRRLKLIDVGTGSGAIAISLARELPEAEVYAVDLSPAALEAARRNAERLGARVHFAQSDVLDSVARDSSFDFVVSNPPYIGLRETDAVEEVVRRHEPPQALFAGEDGLDVIRRLIPQAREALRPGGWLLMEIGYAQAEAVCALLSPQHANSGRAGDPGLPPHHASSGRAGGPGLPPHHASSGRAGDPGLGGWQDVHTTADLAGIARVVLARKPE